MKKILIIICAISIVSLGTTYFLSKSVKAKIDQTLYSVKSVKVIKVKDENFSIGWVGDMVPANDISFNRTVLDNVSVLTQEPSLMIGNLEGTFAGASRYSKCLYITTNCHAFRSDDTFAYTLKSAGFDFISLVNNHSYDYGDDGLLDTEEVLKKVGISYISPTKPSTSITIGEKKIGILGVSFTPPLSTITDYKFIKKEISKLKLENDLVILIFHGGAEGSDKTIVTGKNEYLGDEDRGNVELVAHTAIDAGADIVLGSGPHVLRKVEYYKDKPIIYSAGNFVGGNERLTTSGILGVSAVFDIFIQKDGTFKHKINSIILSKEGVPYIDPLEQAKSLAESLSRK